MKKIITTLALTLTITSNAYAASFADRYNEQYSYDYQNEELAESFRLLNTNETIKDAFNLHQFQRQLDNWYANFKYSKRTVQNSPWVKKDRAIRGAWAEGFDGEGVNIGVIDWYGPNNTGHGDKTSAIAGGVSNIGNVNTVGIAPEANVTKYNSVWTERWLTDNSSVYTDSDIINISLGISPIPTRESFGTPETNALITKSAGNDSRTCSNRDNCDEFAVELVNTFNNNVLVVGSIDANNNLKDYSNRAGVLSNNFVVDTGDYRVGTLHDNIYVSGTSYAAPTVAGKAAIIKSKFNNLSGSALANLIKTTADDLGAPGVDNVYGHGKVNLGRALSPVGGLN